VKQTPELDAAQHQMQPGYISRDGFLGTDQRSLRAILVEDEQRTAALGLTHRTIAERLRYFTEAGKQHFGAPVTVDEVYEVRAEEARGVLRCPWPHPGVFGKTNVHLRRTDTGEELAWTELQIHLIEVHGFYQGEGSRYRLSPGYVQRVLGLQSEDTQEG